MRISALAGFALLAILNGAALAAPSASDGWYVIQPTLRPHTPKSRVPHYEFGAGATAGMTGKQAVYIANNVNSSGGTMNRDISLAAWRGQRIRLSLSLKSEGGARPSVALEVINADTNGVSTARQPNESGGNAWETHKFVLAAPGNADKLVVHVGFRGVGRVWVDDVTLEAVAANVALSETRRFINTAPRCYGSHDCIGDAPATPQKPRALLPRTDVNGEP